MNDRFAYRPIRWTEEELRKDIARIEDLLTRGEAATAHGHCARAYLEQVLKDRKSTLKILKIRSEEQAPRESASTGTFAAPWPAPPTRSSFRPLLRV